uniref:Uncharacterized protein n=1 Tax=Rhizophagus irregularis (strain DAOM 181602 / DAOM 197198 / MUCL 43194) TaxID=747089 RepID=U9SXL9_RHIID
MLEASHLNNDPNYCLPYILDQPQPYLQDPNNNAEDLPTSKVKRINCQQMENRGIVNIALFFIKDANRIDCCACRTLLLQPDWYTWTGLQQTVPKALDSAKIEDMNKNHGTIWIFIEKFLSRKTQTCKQSSMDE